MTATEFAKTGYIIFLSRGKHLGNIAKPKLKAKATINLSRVGNTLRYYHISYITNYHISFVNNQSSFSSHPYAEPVLALI